MYRTTDYDYEQLSFVNFNTTCGMQLDRDNEWIKTSSRLPDIPKMQSASKNDIPIFSHLW